MNGEFAGARIELQSPSPLVGSMVVKAARRQEIDEIRRSQLVPFDEVMDVAPIEGAVASVDCARGVHRTERRALCACRETTRAGDVERLVVAFEHHREDVRIAREPSG